MRLASMWLATYPIEPFRLVACLRSVRPDSQLNQGKVNW